MPMKSVDAGPRAGDWIEARGVHGQAPRRGEILEVLGREGHEHYRVRWDEQHESIVYPADGVIVTPGPGRRGRGAAAGAAPDDAHGARPRACAESRRCLAVASRRLAAFIQRRDAARRRLNAQPLERDGAPIPALPGLGWLSATSHSRSGSCVSAAAEDV